MKNLNHSFIILLLSFPLISLGADTLTDPTKPPTVIYSPKTTTTNQPLLLTGTFIYPNYRMARINDQLLKTGDQIGDFTITSIASYTVELTGSQGNKLVLQLIPVVKLQPQH